MFQNLRIDPYNFQKRSASAVFTEVRASLFKLRVSKHPSKGPVDLYLGGKCKQESIYYNPEYKSIRLDIYAKDEENTCYNVELSGSYVIFVCDFDPFGKGKYRYTFENRCEELSNLILEDGSHTIFLSTKGKNEDEVSEELVNFLKYVSADLEESTKDFNDDFVSILQKSVQNVKSSREMEAKFLNPCITIF